MHLRPLRSESVAIRKAGARALVGKARQADGTLLRALFVAESEPEVIKWLGMVIARARIIEALPDLHAKRAACSDDNARDWLAAADAVLQPLESGRRARRLIASPDELERREGAVLAWGCNSVEDTLHRYLLRNAADGDELGLRRWSTLALHQHRQRVPVSALIDSITGGDVPLREWSLHVLTSQPNTDALPVVQRIIKGAPCEHPRVVEWAVHALSAVDNMDVVPLIINVFYESHDAGVREACICEVAAHLSALGVDFLVAELDRSSDPLLAIAVLRGLGPELRNAPPGLRLSIESAIARLQGSASLVALAAGALAPETLSLSQQATVMAALADPVVRTAVRLGLRAGDRWDGMAMTRDQQLIVGVLIALDEELGYYLDAVGIAVEAEISTKTGASYLLHRLRVGGACPVTLVVRLVDHKGGEHAAVAATQLLTEYAPAFLVNLGISGSLHDDIGLGTVVVGDTVTAWAANSRIEDAKRGGGFLFRLAGEPYRADKWLSDRAAGVRREAPVLYAQWQKSVTPQFEHLSPSGSVIANVVRGDLAAGPSVAASAAFKRFLADHKRDYTAIDMESSGVATAAWSDAVRRVRLLILRGVSDPADADKTLLEKSSKGAFRRLAMYAATQYLLTALKHIAKQPLPS